EPQPSIPFGPRAVGAFFRNFPYWVTDNFMKSDRGEIIGRLRSKARLASAMLPSALTRGSRPTPKADIRDIVGAWRAPEELRPRPEAEYQALTTYVPQVYSGRITLFRARAGPLLRFSRWDMGWSDLAASGVDVRVVPGSHVTMLVDPYVRVLAQELTRCLSV